MSANQFSVVLVSRRELALDVFELTFAMREPSEIDFRPGQFVSIKINDGHASLAYRAYSIASAPTSKTDFVLAIKLVRGKNEDGSEFIGRGSGYLHTLKIGAVVEMLGPSGILPFDENESASLLLLGTGTGIAPLKSMAEYLSALKSPRKIQLYFGVRYPADIFYAGEFAALAKNNPNFEFTIACSRPTENYAGTSGRLPDVLARDFPNGISDDRIAYVCGGVTSSNGIREKLTTLGLPAEKIHVEGYGV